MTRDDIIRLAREAGAATGRHSPYQKNESIMPLCMDVERFAALVAAAEREACADICERRKSLYWMEFDKTGSDADRSAAIASEECATAICARGQ